MLYVLHVYIGTVSENLNKEGCIFHAEVQEVKGQLETSNENQEYEDDDFLYDLLD